MKLSAQDYRNKTLGCWLGKTIGGTLGEPMEWRRQRNEVSFYWQDLNGEPRPNDDLDIQLIWLNALEMHGLEIDAQLLGDYWTLYNDAHWSEYGNAKANLKSGLNPPLSGSMHNDFKDSDGSYIRSEIWATICPGNPELAARYAYEDAIVDHGDGEGTYAEVFCAVVEAAAYLVQDINKLVEIGLSYIPEQCAVSQAIRRMIECYRQGMSAEEMRIDILQKFRGEVYWGRECNISLEDKALGLDGGKPGFDVPVNMAFTMAGLFYGEGDFGKTLCINAMLGEDTDCTCATAGSIFGILCGADAIPEKWIKPIGYGITTLCLNKADMCCCGMSIPATVQELTERTYALAQQVLLRNRSLLQLSETEPTSLIYDIPEWEGRRNFIHVQYVDMSLNGTEFDPDSLLSPDHGAALYSCMGGPVYRNHQFTVAVDYLEDGAAVYSEEKTIRIKLRNHSRNIQEFVNFKWYLPDEWTVSPARSGKVFMTTPFLHKADAELAFTFTIPQMQPVERLVLELTMDGRSFVQLVPVVFTREFR